jgi:adenosylcobinamide-phosphate synthase
MPAALIAFAAALLIDLLFGDLPNRFHPVVAMGSFIRKGAKNAAQGPPLRQFFGGVGWMVLGGAIFCLPWFVLFSFTKNCPLWLYGIILGLLLKPMFAIRRLLEAGMEIYTALDRDDLAKARHLVSWHLVSRDTRQLSTGQVTSAVIESLAENLTDSFFAPVLAFALGGIPFAWFYRFVNTADAMIGYRTPQFEYYGKFAARLDDILNWVPARLAAIFLVAAAWLCHLDARNAWTVMLSQHSRTSSPNAGWTMAAAAGALRVRLEKVNTYRLDGGNEYPSIGDIKHIYRLISVAVLICSMFCGGLLIGLSLFF